MHPSMNCLRTHYHTALSHRCRDAPASTRAHRCWPSRARYSTYLQHSRPNRRSTTVQDPPTLSMRKPKAPTAAIPPSRRTFPPQAQMPLTSSSKTPTLILAIYSAATAAAQTTLSLASRSSTWTKKFSALRSAARSPRANLSLSCGSVQSHRSPVASRPLASSLARTLIIMIMAAEGRTPLLITILCRAASARPTRCLRYRIEIVNLN